MGSDRRTFERVNIDLWVEEQTDGATYFQHATNLSSGGVYLDHTLPHPPGTRVVLDLHIPGGDAPLRVSGEVVEADRDLGMGVRFLGLSDEARERIERHIQSARDSQRPPPA